MRLLESYQLRSHLAADFKERCDLRGEVEQAA